MKVALALLVLLCLAPLRAHAITPSCYPWTLSSAGYEQTTQPTNVVKWFSIDAGKASFVVSFYCDEKYGWGQYYFYGYRKDLTPSWQSILVALPTLSKTDVDALWMANVTTPDPKLEAIAARQLDATRPPDILWRVRPNGTQTARPVYRLNANGTRNTTAPNNVRVQVGAVCQCARKVVEEPVSGSDAVNAYCDVGGLDNVATPFPDAIDPGLVTWCARS